ncbi:DUF4352 domain-containing protein [Knoellia locipacati]|uniref:DUF4352 domain-containing protein n=1 Tax=Knoellia locipacati TaxID=882824 RepID=UPI00384D0E8D
MNHHLRTAAALAVVALISAGCAEKNQVAEPGAASPTVSESRNWPPPDEATPTDDPVVETPTPTPTLGQAQFGETGSFTQDDTNSFTVNVAAPGKAKCQYSSLGCEKPKTGDRVVTTKVVIKNTSSAPIEVSSSQFVVEFADGTRLEPNDGAASDYTPDNAMEYSQTMRPGSTYSSTLTFEAPKGPFAIIMLTDSFGGDDLFMWK